MHELRFHHRERRLQESQAEADVAESKSKETPLDMEGAGLGERSYTQMSRANA
jgi:hypothetical protein